MEKEKKVNIKTLFANGLIFMSMTRDEITICDTLHGETLVKSAHALNEPCRVSF